MRVAVFLNIAVLCDGHRKSLFLSSTRHRRTDLRSQSVIRLRACHSASSGDPARAVEVCCTARGSAWGPHADRPATPRRSTHTWESRPGTLARNRIPLTKPHEGIGHSNLRQWKVRPPSTASAEPVTCADSAQERKSAACAMSSGRPTRRMR